MFFDRLMLLDFFFFSGWTQCRIKSVGARYRYCPQEQFQKDMHGNDHDLQNTAYLLKC